MCDFDNRFNARNIKYGVLMTSNAAVSLQNPLQQREKLNYQHAVTPLAPSLPFPRLYIEQTLLAALRAQI